MSFTTGLSRPLAQVQAGAIPTIYNVPVPLAATEVSQTLSDSTKKFIIRVRGDAKLQLAFDSGQSGVEYITVPPGASFTEESILFTGTLYFQTTKPNQVVEILEWV
jgi:hypothetical protein